MKWFVVMEMEACRSGLHKTNFVQGIVWQIKPYIYHIYFFACNIRHVATTFSTSVSKDEIQ